MLSKEKLIDKNSPIPAYHQIVKDMLDRITANEWKMNARLPSEPKLAEAYSVSRVTIRQAMAELEKRQIIVRHQGRGAFLIGQPQPFVENLNLPSVGQVPDPSTRNASTLIELRVDDNPPQYVVDAFKSDAKNFPLIYLCRVFAKKNFPIGLNHAWFPSGRVPGFVEDGLVHESVTATLRERYGYDITRVDNIIEATKANANDAFLLEVSYDDPLLKIQSSHYTNEDILIQFSNTLWVGDLTRFRFTAK